MSITFSFEENIKETSQFYSDDPELFNSLTLKENILVDITANILDFMVNGCFVSKIGNKVIL